MNLIFSNKLKIFNLILNTFKFESVNALDILLDNLIKTNSNLITKHKYVNIEIILTIFNFTI